MLIVDKAPIKNINASNLSNLKHRLTNHLFNHKINYVTSYIYVLYHKMQIIDKSKLRA